MSRGEINRRVEVSAEISASVYEFEKFYVNNINSLANKDKVDFIEIRKELAKNDAPLPSNTELTDYYYDPSTGVAAIAVKDLLTGETYIAYAGTNVDADSVQDPISDLHIGFSNQLPLRRIEDSATAFYREVQKSGANITVTTGHSYGDFLATRVAIVEQTPYKFGYQGAPQSVSTRSFLEINYNLILLSGQVTKEELDAWIRAEKMEEERVNQLIANYSGYSATFATTADALTNALWEQKPNEIQFDGRVVLGGFDLDLAKSLLLHIVKRKLNTEVDTTYVGNVIAIDVPIEHDMSAYKSSMEAMYYTVEAVLADLYSVDFDRDGNAEFVLGPEYTTRAPIIPNWASGGGGSDINLDIHALQVVATNLRGIATYLSDLVNLNSQGLSANQEVIDRVGQRKGDYKDVISNQLEAISLIQAVKDIDTAFEQIINLESVLTTVSNYNRYEFTRRFDNWGGSILYSWYNQNGSHWNYYSVEGSLSALSRNAEALRTIARNNSDAGPSKFLGFITIGARTNVAKKGEELINSFEEEIESVTKGMGNRSSFSDGIPLAIKEILEVIHYNLQALIQCVNYTVEVVEKIRATMVSVDAQLASDISQLDLSALSPVDVSIHSNYQTFLESTGVFDDLKVLQAYDDQIDKKADELASSMSQSFSSYLSAVSSEISSTNARLSRTITNCSKLNSQMADTVYYRQFGEKEKHYYGRVSDFISIAYAVPTISSECSEIDRALTVASTRVNTVISSLGNLYEPFRRGAEDAIYGLNGLEAIVKSQMSISDVLLSMKSRFEDMQAYTSSNKGVAISALDEKMAEIITLMATSEQLISDCFG